MIIIDLIFQMIMIMIIIGLIFQRIMMSPSFLAKRLEPCAILNGAGVLNDGTASSRVGWAAPMEIPSGWWFGTWLDYDFPYIIYI
jgi:hypothetical protein